jgi:protein phosphatase
MSRGPAPEAAPPPVARRRPRWRRWLIALAVLVLVLGALGGTYAWTQTQYFVGKAGADVAIYRGVDTEFGPLKFFTVYKVTNLPVADLQPSYRTQVEDGITAHSRGEAENIVDNLRNQQLPACLPSATSSPPASASPSATASGSASASASVSVPPPSGTPSAEPCPAPQ